MKNLLLIALLFIVTEASANDTSYYAVLRNSLELSEKEYSLSTYQNLANTCERILALRENEWLVQYYRAYAYAHMGYMTKEEEKKDAMLDKAQASVDAALTLNPEESEIYLVVALICYGRMEINPMFRSATYFPKANEALEKAKEFNQKNPRIYYLEGQSTLYKPAFLGGGAEAALPLLEKSLQYFAEFVPPNDIFPHWGEEESLLLYQRCKDKIEE